MYVSLRDQQFYLLAYIHLQRSHVSSTTAVSYRGGDTTFPKFGKHRSPRVGRVSGGQHSRAFGIARMLVKIRGVCPEYRI